MLARPVASDGAAMARWLGESVGKMLVKSTRRLRFVRLALRHSLKSAARTFFLIPKYVISASAHGHAFLTRTRRFCIIMTSIFHPKSCHA